MTLAKRMIQFRAINNLSQSEFGKLCGMNQSYISNIENESRIPGKMAREKLELVLNGEKIKTKEDN